MIARRARCYGFLAGALSCFFCTSCFCFVNCCCLFFSLSFLPPLSPMPAPFQSFTTGTLESAPWIIRNRRETTLPQLQQGRVTGAAPGFQRHLAGACPSLVACAISV